MAGAIFTPQQASHSLEPGVTSRDAPHGVSQPQGSDSKLRPSLLYNQCMFLADVSRSCPGAI